MFDFIYYAPTKIYFGVNKIRMLSGELSPYRKIMLVYGQGSIKKNGIYNDVTKQLKKSNVAYVEHSGIFPNPRLTDVYKGISLAKREKVDFILAVGGGSVIDTAKAIAAGFFFEGDIWECLEKHVGPSKALPLGVVLTVAASGSEMNGNMVITNMNTKEKRACGSPVLIPRFAILNPEYTYTLNKSVTVAGICDIMTHVFEAYLSPIENADLQNEMAAAILKVCIDNAYKLLAKNNDYYARANLMWASSLALNGIVQKGKMGDWLCHAIEHELSGLYDIRHGEGLAVILPNLMTVSLNNENVSNYVHYAKRVWNITDEMDDFELACMAIEKTRDFFIKIGLPSSLSSLGIDDTYFEQIAETALRVRGNVRHYKQLNKDDIIKVLKLSL